MTRLRIAFVIVLALLLPVRGALAAAMACAHGGIAPSPACAMHEAQAALPHHGLSEAAGSDGTAHAEPTALCQGQCPLCAAGCSLTPLAVASTQLPEPLHAAALRFPEQRAPAPSFVAGGPERPPRSI